jgi:hypothetical protein
MELAESRRGYRRIPIELVVNLSWRTRTGTKRRARAKTENMSGTGLFMAAPVRLRRETPIHFTIVLPSEITRVPLELTCRGRVVRASRAGEPAGFGAVIDEYELRPMSSQA